MIEFACLIALMWIYLAWCIKGVWNSRSENGIRTPTFWASQGPPKTTAKANADAKTNNKEGKTLS